MLKKPIGKINDLVGLEVLKVENLNNEIIRIQLKDGRNIELHHDQDCCESVYVESIVGDLEDLVGEIKIAKEETNHAEKGLDRVEYTDGSHTWTFYTFATNKGYVDIRFFGTSNGYYSESVDMHIYEREIL